MPTSKLIPEFIIALQEEIKALKKGKGGSVVRVFSGRLIRETSGQYVYVFHLENFLAAIDDSPAEIEVGGTRCPCQIVSVQGMEVQVALERNLGQQIAEARIHTNLWYLLELLLKKFEESSSDSARFSISEHLFAGTSTYINGKKDAPKYTLLPEAPNESQARAIAASYNKSLSVIWGPPGTGKTKTIAKAVEAHLNAGRRVLLVSHANMAVDEALEDIAEQLKTTGFYQEGKLIRLGICQKKNLEENYPLVILDQIAAKLGESLAQEKAKLLTERGKIDRFLESFAELIHTQSAVDSLAREVGQMTEFLSEFPGRIDAVNKRIQEEQSHQSQSREKLTKANQSGALKRLFLGLDPKKIQKEIDQLTISIDARRRTLAELEQEYFKIKTDYSQKKSEHSQLAHRLAQLLNKFGLTSKELNTEKETMEARRDVINNRVAEIDKLLDGLQRQALAEARLVATTLTKTFTAKQFPDQPFDVLIVDEASMAPLPHLYWAAGRSSMAVTVVGDFKQLPPICISDDVMARKWLGRSIFDVIGIVSVQDAGRDDRVTLLDTQYRMAPAIAAVPNRFFYEGMLKDHPNTAKLLLDDTLSGQSSLVVVDTTAVNPWCSHPSAGGRFNIYSALVSVTVARKLLDEENLDKVGIVTPYRAQARLIGKIANDWGILSGIRINTVHSFQGGEESVIILDSVEGPGVSKWSMLDDQRPNSDARLLLNVALTRAKYKVYLIAHRSYLKATLSNESIINQIIDYISRKGAQLYSEDLVDHYLATDFEKWATASLGPTERVDPDEGSLYTEKNFWPAFDKDLQSVKENLIIMSPFMTLRRAGRLMEYFRAILSRGVKIKVYTRPPKQQGGTLEEHAEQVIEHLETLGAKVIQRKSMHQKVAIIDNKVVWEGSLNILSHKDTQEQMRRLEGENAVQEVIRNLDLDKAEAGGNIVDKLCPLCGKKGIESKMVARNSKFGPFYGCSRFPSCRHTENISKKSR